jgi:hypothetical protein
VSDALQQAIASMRSTGRLGFREFLADGPSVAPDDRIGEGYWEPVSGVTVVRSASATPRALANLGDEGGIAEAFAGESEMRFERGVRLVRSGDASWTRGYSLPERTRQLADPIWGLDALGLADRDEARRMDGLRAPPSLAESDGVKVDIAWSRLRQARLCEVPGRLSRIRLGRALGQRDLPILVWLSSEPWIRAMSHPASMAGGRPLWRSVAFDPPDRK